MIFSFLSFLLLKYVENIWDIVTSNSATKYSESKMRLLDLFKENESTGIKKNITKIDLSNLKPNQLLEKLKSGNRCVTSRLRFLAIFFFGAIIMLFSHQ